MNASKPRVSFAAKARLAVLSVAALLLAVSTGFQALAQDAVTTLEEGKLTVGFSDAKPVSYLDGDKLTGVDGDIITAVATALGLTVVPVESSFAESLAAAEAGTVDVAIGDIFGTEERAAMFALTAPVYYNATIMAVRDGVTVATVEDLADKIVGTGEGYSYVPELQAIPGIKEVKEYATADEALADLGAGTIDAAVLDPPVLSLAAKDHADWKLQLVAVPFDAAAYPILSTVNPAVFVVNPANPDLAAAITAEIAKMQADGSIKTILETYGLTDASYTTAPAN